MKKHQSQPKVMHSRLLHELRTIEAMIEIYCGAHHAPAVKKCDDCQQLYQYAMARLNHCPFQQHKPTCGNCTIHCYKKEMEQTIRKVMRYSGPRMTYRHPVMALRHLLDSRRKAPVKPKKTNRHQRSSATQKFPRKFTP